MAFRLNILGLALALVPFVSAGFDSSSSPNMAVYWGKHPLLTSQLELVTMGGANIVCIRDKTHTAKPPALLRSAILPTTARVCFHNDNDTV